MTETKVLRFGECELDIASREFRRGGDLVSIEPRVFALLLFLIEHRSRAVDEVYSRGLSDAHEGRCAEALDLFEVVTSRADTVSRADYEWANCARILGRWEDAEARFNKMLEALTVEPSSSMRAMTMHGLGTVYIRTGRHELAREILSLGLAEANSAGDRVTQGKLDDADEHLQQALATFRALGDIAQRQADSDAAIDAYENTLSHVQEWGFVAKQSRVMRKLADAHIEQDDLAAAEPLIGRLIELGESAVTGELLQRYREAQAI